MHVQMLFIVKCLSMYILFDQELSKCEQALCGSEPAQTAQTTVLEALLRSKVVFTDFAQNGVTYIVRVRVRVRVRFCAKWSDCRGPGCAMPAIKGTRHDSIMWSMLLPS